MQKSIAKKLKYGGKNIMKITKISNAISKAKSNVTTFMYSTPYLAKPIAIAGTVSMMATNAVFADFSPDKAISKMVGYVTSILMGVGIIYAFIAIFNWVAAMKREDAESQSKQIVNIFIAGILIAIKPVSIVIINALGGDASVIE